MGGHQGLFSRRRSLQTGAGQSVSQSVRHSVSLPVSQALSQTVSQSVSQSPGSGSDKKAPSHQNSVHFIWRALLDNRQAEN